MQQIKLLDHVLPICFGYDHNINILVTKNQ